MSNSEYIEKYHTYLVKQAQKLTNSKDQAREWVQDLAVYLLTNSNYKGDTTCIKSRHNYSWGVFYNWFRDSQKPNSKRWTTLELNENDIVESTQSKEPLVTIYEAELRLEGYTDDQIFKLSRIQSYIKRSSPSKRNIFKLYFTDDLTYREISKRVGIPITSVYYMVNKLKAELYLASQKPQKPLY